MDWQRPALAGAVILVTVAAARLVDRAIARRMLAPELSTRYRVVRRTAVTALVAVGVLSALLTVPAVRAVAGGILASSAVAALVIGFAAQRTLANAVAGVLIAFTQPLRLGDRVEVGGRTGAVEDIRLTYTFIRLDDGSRLVIPNDKLASDTIVNSTILSPEKVAEITVQLPLATDLGPVLDALREEFAGEPGADVSIRSLEGGATVAVGVRAAGQAQVETLRRDLYRRAHARLRAAGAFA